MASRRFTGLSLVDRTNLEEAKRQIVDYWNSLSVCEDTGGTSWDVLDEIRSQVTEAISRGTLHDIRWAMRLTAKAEFLRGGVSD
jgi:hypothetical protein